MLEKVCPVCSAPFLTFPSQNSTYCSRKCAGKSRQNIRRPLRPLSERFWEKVDRRGPNECWPWIGKTKFSDGRGKFRTEKFMQTSNYVAFELTYGPLQPGEYACHSCDFPPCCNPAHLFRGSHKKNMEDCRKKNRRIYWDLQKAIALRNQGLTIKEIATIVGTTPSSVRKVFLLRNINTSDLRHGTNKWPVDEAIILFTQGHGFSRIAGRFGVSMPTVRKALNKRGFFFNKTS